MYICSLRAKCYNFHGLSQIEVASQGWWKASTLTIAMSAKIRTLKWKIDLCWHKKMFLKWNHLIEGALNWWLWDGGETGRKVRTFLLGGLSMLPLNSLAPMKLPSGMKHELSTFLVVIWVLSPLNWLWALYRVQLQFRSHYNPTRIALACAYTASEACWCLQLKDMGYWQKYTGKFNSRNLRC